MLKPMRVLILCIALFLSMFSVVFADRQKEWISITTGVDSNGTETTTQVFGYYLNTDKADQIFVICNPNTWEETGKAYVPGVQVGVMEVMAGYKTQYGEYFDIVKRIDPVRINMFAPNIFTDIKYGAYSYEQRDQTDELYQYASSTAAWPGSAKGYLIPGSDPDYWLVVDELYNPNNWPVRVKIKSTLGTFRDSFNRYPLTKTVNLDKEIYLNANEKKCILVNRGKPAGCRMLADELTNKGAWSSGYLYAYVTENLDPELPERLRKNNGYAKLYDYYGGGGLLLGETDLSGGFDIDYKITCKDPNDNWYFTGTVCYTGNGWVAVPGKGTTNAAAAKTQLENMLNAGYPDPTLTESGRFPGVEISDIKYTGPGLVSGPAMERNDICGPALMDYTGVNEDCFDLNQDAYVYSRDGIPVLVYEPLFIEYSRFEPSGGAPDEGSIVKEVKPGFVVSSSNIYRPRIVANDRVKDYCIKTATEDRGWYKNTYWVVTLNHHVTLTAENPGNYKMSFTDFALALPNIQSAVRDFEESLEDHYHISGVEVDLPSYTDRNTEPVLERFATITMAPGQSSVIYDEDVTTEIRINQIVGLNPDTEYDDVTLEQEAIAQAVNRAIQGIDWSGEAAFRYGAITVDPGDEKIKIASFSKAELQYYDNTFKKYYTQSVGLAGNDSIYLRNISYFKNGVALRATDEIWISLLASRRLSGNITDDEFWPACTYNSSYGVWRFEDRFKA